MRRFMPFAVVPAVLIVLAVGLSPGLRAEDQKITGFTDLDAKAQKELCERARAYLDPEVEFLWRPRKELLAALDALEKDTGIRALANLPFLRELIYQGRHFKPPFDDRKWQSANAVEGKKKSIFYNVKSEEWRFTYTTPKKYPKKGDLAKTPRKGEPFPLLVTLHEMDDTRSSRGPEEYPGMAVLERRYPKGEFGSLYDSTLTLAPVAARARFLEDDGRVRHLFLTGVITEFLRHYHVDFDRILIDGTDAAAALCATFPHIFAGLILRGGKIEPDLVKNYAAVPVFVVTGSKTKGLKQALEDAGHPDVSEGSGKDAVVWMSSRKRQVPASFEWHMSREDHRFANWITLLSGAPTRNLKVVTDRDNNKITITAEGVEYLQLYLNDEVVNLDNEITVVVNGQESKYREERSFAQLFDKDPFVRRNMSFYWLYPVRLEEIAAPEPKKAGPEPSDVKPPSTPPDEGPKGTPEEEAEAKKWYDRGVEEQDAGNKERARTWFKKARDVGETSYKRKAEAKLAELEEKSSGDGD